MDRAQLFEAIKKEAEDSYRELDSIFCPYLKTEVKFNAKGLDHIKMKEWNKTRLIADQYLRLKFLKLVPDVLSASGTVQDYKETQSFERLKLTGKWQSKMVPVKYYGFVAIVKSVRIKIIVKKVESSAPYFWSIIPFWKTNKDNLTGQIKKVFHEGDLERD